MGTRTVVYAKRARGAWVLQCGGDVGMCAVRGMSLRVVCVCGFVRLGMGWDGMGRLRMWAGIVDGTVYGVGFWIEGNE